MTKEQIALSSKIVNAYLEKYPDTSTFDLIAIALQANNEIERCGDSAEKNIDTIVDNIHELLVSDTPSWFELFGFPGWCSQKREQKKPCSCGNKAEKPVQSTKAEGKPSSQGCRCSNNSNSKTWVSDTCEMKTVKILVPGVKKENISLTVNDSQAGKSVLTLKLKDIVIESAFVNPDMCVTVALDELCNTEEMKASLDLGILTIEIPKRKEVDTSRTIEIL